MPTSPTTTTRPRSRASRAASSIGSLDFVDAQTRTASAPCPSVKASAVASTGPVRGTASSAHSCLASAHASGSKSNASTRPPAALTSWTTMRPTNPRPLTTTHRRAGLHLVGRPVSRPRRALRKPPAHCQPIRHAGEEVLRYEVHFGVICIAPSSTGDEVAGTNPRTIRADRDHLAGRAVSEYARRLESLHHRPVSLDEALLARLGDDLAGELGAGLEPSRPSSFSPSSIFARSVPALMRDACVRTRAPAERHDLTRRAARGEALEARQGQSQRVGLQALQPEGELRPKEPELSERGSVEDRDNGQVEARGP
jgi:hypothetical protein